VFFRITNNYILNRQLLNYSLYIIEKV